MPIIPLFGIRFLFLPLAYKIYKVFAINYTLANIFKENCEGIMHSLGM